MNNIILSIFLSLVCSFSAYAQSNAFRIQIGTLKIEKDVAREGEDLFLEFNVFGDKRGTFSQEYPIKMNTDGKMTINTILPSEIPGDYSGTIFAMLVRKTPSHSIHSIIGTCFLFDRNKCVTYDKPIKFRLSWAPVLIK